MKNIMNHIIGCVAISLLLAVGSVQADPGSQYCVTPPFITAGIPPNLLLMMDNSASMFDLAYADKGTTTRTPTYCYDNTYSDVDADGNTNSYAGYFKETDYYDFNIGTGVFALSADPGAGSCSYYVANKYCITVDTAVPKRVTKFSASGNYLNWLTASKFDVQKKILTGGKYNVGGGYLEAESRGCVGRGFIKQPLSTNSGNYVEGGTNTAIPVTLQIKGQLTSYDEAAPSQGGQTSIYFYYGTTPYDSAKCSAAIGVLSDGSSLSGPDKTLVLECIGATGGSTDLSGKKKQIFAQSLPECKQYLDNDPDAFQGSDYLTVKNFCTDIYNSRDQDHGPLSFNPASDIKVGDADLLCGANYVGACYSGTRLLASIEPSRFAPLFDLLQPKSAFAAAPLAGNFQFSLATYTVAESAANATLTVNRSGGCDGAATVSYSTSNGTATAGSDYTAKTSTVAFANNDCAAKTITVAITNDGTAESNETINATLNSTTAGAIGSINSTVVTILDDDGPPPAGTITLSSAAYSVTEGSASVTITVNRSGGTASGVGVSYATSNGTATAGTHYTTTSGTLSWGSNETVKTFAIPIVYNSANGDKTFTVTISAATGGASLGAPSSAVVTIIDDSGGGSLNLSSSTYAISENTTPLTITVTRSGGNTGAASVNYATSNGSAASGTNYSSTSGTLTWANGVGGNKTFTIPIINAASTADKTFTVTLSGISGATLGSISTATVTITFTGSVPGPGTWTSSWTSDACVTTQHALYCGGLSIPPVTDPTDAPGDTSVTGNLPAVIGDMAIGGQLGAPLKILSGSTVLDGMLVRLSTANPSGLIQTFASKIRVGLMSFNYTGSPSECVAGSTVPCPKVCSNDAAKTCSSYLECCQNSNECSCDATTANGTNADGAKVLYLVGNGTCSHDSSVTCTTNENCVPLNAASTCVTAGAGSHSSGLVSQIDSLKAASWTPFSEAFYNAIGYFAYTAPTLSKTSIRINDGTNAGQPIDFPADRNPSEYVCQQNNILLISDGVSTADQRTEVMTLANTAAYKTGAVLSGGACAAYKGSSNLPILSWLARNKNISDFNTASTQMRDKISTYVVYTGQDNGVLGECNSNTLMSNTATKGGGKYYPATNYQELEDGLRRAFEEISAQAASGTAASILSNSEGSGANILQAVFYPKKVFDNATEANWVGEMQNLWYYVDPYVNNSTIREDTDVDYKLNVKNDYVTRFAFDSASNKTMVQLYQDVDGNGTGDTAIGGLIDPDSVKSLWRAGKLLWERNIDTSPRKLVTSINADDPTAPPSLIYFASSTYPIGTVASSKATLLYPYLNVADAPAAENLINWVHGLDTSVYRSRTVKIENVPHTTPATYQTGTWRLGDIISSTPRVQSTVRLNSYNMPFPGGYSDKSYESYINSSNYKSRGMVYVGGNDGMLHAFNLGILSVESSGFQKATLSGSNRGKEEWAYIPKHTLPYLKYLADPGYSHIYSIDGRTSVFDASIGYTNVDTCTRAGYDTCDKLKNSTVVNSSTNVLDPLKNTWRTVVIGGMGIGGASTKTCAAGSDCVQTPITDPGDLTNNPGLGYSSYFALDVTNPLSPQLLWEYKNPALGYSTTGPAIVRIGSPNKNGKWYAVFGSGPTGPINTTTRQFLGRSNQNLKFFVVDLQTGVEERVIDTGIANAFAGSMLGSSIDIDRGAPYVTGNYQDDAIYVGYTKINTAADPDDWTQGGVGRIITKESNTVADWAWSKVLDDLGPVTTAISRIQDKKNRNLWLFFGTGRYFFRDSESLDDKYNRRALFGIKEPCYNTVATPGNFLDKACTAPQSETIADRTTSLSTTGDGGWKINLDEVTSAGAERVVTDTVALTNGSVFFTTFKPSLDLCSYGGSSYLWGVKYDTGGAASANALTGKALIQLSTGEFKEVDLATAFTGNLNRRIDTPMTGKPPSDAPPIVSNSQNRPVKKILHIKEH